MRLVRIKLKPDLRKLLGEISHELSIDDRGMTEDLFCLMRNKGSGLPTDDRIERMADVISQNTGKMRALILLSLRKRRYVLKQIISLNFFKALCMEHAANPSAGVRVLLQVFRDMSRKIRQAQCLTCQHRPQCDFGKQFGESVTDITKVIDPNYAKKVHNDCPHRPEIDQINQMAIFANQFAQVSPTNTGVVGKNAAQMQQEFEDAMKKLQEELDKNPMSADEDASPDDLDPEEMAEDNVGIGLGGMTRGATPDYRTTHTGATFSLINQKLVNQMTAEKMVLFEIGHQLQEMLAKATKGKYKPVTVVNEKSKVENIKSMTEISSVSPAQHALPDDQFNARVAKRSLQVRKFEEPEEKKFLLYTLLDTSGSMIEALGARGALADSWGLVTRGQIAATLAIALMSRVRDDGGIVFHRFFEDGPSPRMQARNKKQFEPLLKAISRADFNGGGTCIPSALNQAFEDITKAKDEIREAELLLITDGDDTIQTHQEQQYVELMKKFKVKLNVLNVNTSSRSHGNAQIVLQRIATKYLKFNPATATVGQFVELVK